MKNAAFALGLVSLVGVLSFGAERVARADIPPPNSTCGDKKAGDSCVDDDKKAGVCTQNKCSRMGMSPGPNGTMERKIVEYDCMSCVASKATITSPAPSSASSGASPAAAPTTDKKAHGCNTSGASTGDAGLFALGALGLIAWRRRRSSVR